MSSLWQGRTDSDKKEYLHQIVTCIDSVADLPLGPSFCFIGFASDEGIIRNKGRAGAKDGPDAIRERLATLAIPPNPFPLYDIGNILIEDHNLEKAQEKLGQLVSQIRKKNIMPIVLGGGHETAWGHFIGLRDLYKTDNVGIFNIDAHFDLRPLVEEKWSSSGTPFEQAALWCKQQNKPFHYFCYGIQETSNSQTLFKRAQELKVNYICAQDILLKEKKDILNKCESFIAKVDKIYLTICLDAFSAAIAPGVSAPQVLGLSIQDVFPILKIIKESKKLVSLDVVELSPPYDRDSMTARLAAQIISFVSSNFCYRP